MNHLDAIQGRLGQWADAEKSFDQCISHDPSCTLTHLNYFYELIAQCKFVEAKSQLDWVLNISPENITTQTEITNLIVLTTGNVKRAITYHKKSRVNDN